MRKPASITAAAAAAAAALVLAAGCGPGEPSLQQGRAIAGKARLPVEQQYKNVSAAVQPVSEQDLNQRSGYTRVCAASSGKQA
jgi:hypothetical protein